MLKTQQRFKGERHNVLIDCNWTWISNFAPALSKEFLDIQATIECQFTLKRVRDMTRTYSHNVLTEEINKTALSSNDDKRMLSIDLIETYAYWRSKDLVCKKEEVKYNNIIKQYKNV